MKNNQNDHFLNSQIAQFYDTPEQRQLLSSYNSPSINPLVQYQLKIHYNFSKDSSSQTENQNKWLILSHLIKNIDNDQSYFISDVNNNNDEKSVNSALNDLDARMNLIQGKE